jgi:hypothetical protein
VVDVELLVVEHGAAIGHPRQRLRARARGRGRGRVRLTCTWTCKCTYRNGGAE